MFEKLAEKIRGKGTNTEEISFKPYKEEVRTVDPKSTEAPVSAAIEEPQGANLEMKITYPKSFDEVGVIADYLIAGCTVVLNIDTMPDKQSVLRMLDFLNGVTYTMDGGIKKISKNSYLITPKNVDVQD